MIDQLPQSTGRTLAFRMSGKLHDDDYRHFVPIVETAIEAHGTVRLLAEFKDFHGWDPHAVWDDTKFATKHCADVERIALVGDKKWEEWMAKICVPFTLAKLRYFDVSDADAAWTWLTQPD
jgi:SpoIIAA-like